jgi:hypothetical protein
VLSVLENQSLEHYPNMSNPANLNLETVAQNCERRLALSTHRGSWFGAPTMFHTDAAIYGFATLTKIKAVLDLDRTLQHVQHKEKLAESIFKDARKLFVIFLVKKASHVFSPTAGHPTSGN